jgi:hypothetical protein
MAAYLIADVDVTDAAVYEEYKREVRRKVCGPWCADQSVLKAIGNRVVLLTSSSRPWLR